ncbi:aragonite protein [Caudoviricetes sp.]|nr:aragonite protein [Caudoviricetes sp.]
MTQPVALAERIVAWQASHARLLRLAESVPAYSFPDPVERQRAIDEARMVQAQHEAFEQPFKPFER